MADADRIQKRVVPVHDFAEVTVDEERRATVDAARQQQRGADVGGRQGAAVDGADSKRRPLGQRPVALQPGERVVEADRQHHLATPRAFTVPADARQVVGGGCEDVGKAVPQVTAAVAVEVDRIGAKSRRNELHLAESACPRALCIGGDVALGDQLEKIEQLLLERNRSGARPTPEWRRRRRGDNRRCFRHSCSPAPRRRR